VAITYINSTQEPMNDQSFSTLNTGQAKNCDSLSFFFFKKKTNIVLKNNWQKNTGIKT
jgi:hypothetical protein